MGFTVTKRAGLTAFLLVLLAFAEAGCARKVAGVWRGTCAVERQGPTGAAAGEPEQVPTQVTVTPDGDRFRMNVSLGRTQCAWTGAQGASTRQVNNGTELAFPAMPCASIAGNTTGGNAQLSLWSGPDGARFSMTASTRGLTESIPPGGCLLAQ